MFMPCLCLVDPCCRIELWTSMNIPFAIRGIPMQHFALDRNTSPRSAPFVLLHHCCSWGVVWSWFSFFKGVYSALFHIVPIFRFGKCESRGLLCRYSVDVATLEDIPKDVIGELQERLSTESWWFPQVENWEIYIDLPYLHMIWRSILEGKPGNHPDGWVGVERDQKRSVRLWWCQCHAEFPAQTFRCKLKDKNDMELPSESEEEELGQAEATNSVARIWLQKLRINSDGNRVRSVTYRPATRHISSWQVPNGTSEPGTVLKGRDTQRYSEYSYYCDCCRLALVYMHLKRHLCRHTYAHFVDTFVDRPIHLVQKTTCVSLDRKPQAFFNGHIWDM